MPPTSYDLEMAPLLAPDGVSYGDYIEQLTYLLFLKIVQEKDIMMPKMNGYELYEKIKKKYNKVQYSLPSQDHSV
jgi:CheY-like chemotaxis protein